MSRHTARPINVRRVTQPVVVIGGGGMGRCVLDVLDAVNDSDNPASPPFELVGVLDDGRVDSDLLSLWDTEHIGGIRRLSDLASDVGYLIGIGDGRTRRRIDQYGRSMRRLSPVLIHPNAHRGRGVDIGPGSVVCSHVSLENNIQLGRHVHVNQNSTIGHDSRLADYVTVSPLVAMSGNVDAGEAAFLGTGSAIRQGIRLGPDSVVGMSAAVIRDVHSGSTVVGVPAR